MAGYENIRGKGFDSRTTEELRVIASEAGKASGAARRRKADFRKTLNILLTTEIESEEWTPVLKAMGLDSTLESALCASIIKRGLKTGDPKCFEMIARYAGQSDQTEAEQEEQQIRMAAAKTKMGVGSEDEQEDDGFLDALKDSVEDDWSDDNGEEGWFDKGEEEATDI